VKLIADGRVFSGAKAKEMGLVDEIGNFRSAIDITMKLANLEGEPELVYPEKKSEFPFLDALRNGASAAGADLVRGAVETVSSKTGLQNGVLLLAPGLSPSL
jgi:protease-4